MTRGRGFTLIEVMIIVALVGILTTVIYLAVRDHSEKTECRRFGGRVVETDYHTVYVPMSCGQNCTTWVPPRVM